jgi:hypothetical protein
MNTLVHMFNELVDWVKLVKGQYIPCAKKQATHRLKCTRWNIKSQQEPRRLWRPMGYAVAVCAIKCGRRRKRRDRGPIIVNEPIHDDVVVSVPIGTTRKQASAIATRMLNRIGDDLTKGYSFTAARMAGFAASAPLTRRREFHTLAPVIVSKPMKGNMPKAKKSAKVEKDKENGITRPKAGTTCAVIWDIADSLSAKTRQPAQRADVLKAALAKKINEKTITTQFGRWRKYCGLKGRTAAPKKPAKAKKKAKPAKAPASVPEGTAAA